MIASISPKTSIIVSSRSFIYKELYMARLDDHAPIEDWIMLILCIVAVLTNSAIYILLLVCRRLSTDVHWLMTHLAICTLVHAVSKAECSQ
jgi:hypothetical protein